MTKTIAQEVLDRTMFIAAIDAQLAFFEQMKRDDDAGKGRFAAAQAACKLQQKVAAPVGQMKFIGTDSEGFAVFRGASVL